MIGGGPWADLVRDADARFSLGEAPCHWLCLRLMSVTARLAQHLLPEAALVDDWSKLQDSLGTTGGLTIVDVLPLIAEHERVSRTAPLPHSWDVTSDSIAAWLAVQVQARELVLLKSCLPPAGMSRHEAASDSYVDRHFPLAAKSLGVVRCVSLRDVSHAEAELPIGAGLQPFVKAFDGVPPQRGYTDA